jgi:hypothetical protein
MEEEAMTEIHPASIQIGTSRPPLEVVDLPTPEEVFKVARVGRRELIQLVIGPSIIALGISIGSGEWLLGPLNVATYGFTGIGMVVTISALLQTFYNVELARFTVATGEVPVVAFGRAPGGFRFWTPFAVLCLYVALLWGGWAAGCGQALFAFATGRVNTPEELVIAKSLGVAMLLAVFVLVMFGKKISRTMEMLNKAIVAFNLVSLLVLVLLVVPADYWLASISSLVTPAMPPQGSDPTLLGALAGFTAMASGLNFIIINHYRDKGYGMGHRVGYIASLAGRQEAILAAGKIFPEDAKNAALWKRWFRYLVIDQWSVFFVGAILGMLLPCLLVSYLASVPGAQAPTRANMPVYAATQVVGQLGILGFYWLLLVGFLVLFTTQMNVFESLVRNFTDAAYATSSRFRALIKDDPRRFYYPFMILLAALIGALIFQALPTELIMISANMANFAALIFPLVIMYLNSKLPRPARITWWSYLALSLNSLFFGFFFVNFLWMQLFKSPLVTF